MSAMKRGLAACIVLVLLLSGCQDQNRTLSSPAKPDAVSALKGLLATNDDKLYVYQDAAMGWNRFTIKTWVGENGIKPPDMNEYYDQDALGGISSIKAQMDFSVQSWGGYIFTNGFLKPQGTEPEPSSGNIFSHQDLSDATKISFYAKGKEGGEKVSFFCGGMGYNDFGPSMPYSDSTGMINSDAVALSNEWGKYSISLSGKDTGGIGYGFGWIAHAGDNRGKEQIEFYLDEICYEFDQGRREKALLPSYEARTTDTEEYILNNFAFTNDNAVACIALFRAGENMRGQQIADALAFTCQYDRSFSDGRVRNAYTCGNPESYPGWFSSLNEKYSLVPGFLHKETMKWHEDFYAVSTNLTSLAWTILALSEAYSCCPDKPEYLEAAKRVGEFALTLEDDAGFFSGYDGWEGGQVTNNRKSTRDNMEISAAFRRLCSLKGIAPEEIERYERAALNAESYVLSQFDAQNGCFAPGLGVAGSEDTVLLADNAIAVLALPDAYAQQKRQAIVYAEQHLAVESGFACSSADTRGAFWEGTALMALAYKNLGDAESAESLIRDLATAQHADGMLPSASIDELFSGRTNVHDQRKIFYYNRKHAGSTAFMALAELGEKGFRPAG